MTNAIHAEDDDGYVGYVENTHDPGASLICATVLFCILCYSLLPFLVKMGNKLDVKNRQSAANLKGKCAQNQMDGSTRNDQDEPGVDAVFESAEGLEVQSVSSFATFHSNRTRKRRNQRKKRTMGKIHKRDEYELRMQRYGVDDMGYEYTLEESDDNRHRTSSPERSVMEPLDQDDVSMNDAVSLAAKSLQKKILLKLPTTHNENTEGKSPEDSVDDDGTFWETLLDLVTWDFESQRLVKLAVPFATQALSTGLLESITVAVIAKLLGTREVSAFVTVRAIVELSSSFLGSVHESIATLSSQAMGRHNNKLVGQYVQLSMIFYLISYIPFIILWWVKMPSILVWFGFDEETAEIGKEYTQVYLFLELLDGIGESVHALLDVIDLESYSTLIGVSEEVVTFVDILCCALFAKPSLFVIGLIELFVALIFLIINVSIIVWRGWFDPYKDGLIGSCALYNKAAVKKMLGVASALAFGYLLTDGEWEILTLFASALGSAEVAAWAILGVLWDTVEQLTEAVADASEVRCAYLLGSGQPAKAKRSAYKSIFMGFYLALFLSSIVFIVGDNIATLLTNDPALQKIIADLIPLFGIGNMTLTIGTICWTLLGSQGRYRLATANASMASWFVTLPLAALFTFQLRINLQGQTAAIVIGFMVSGTVNSYYLFRSDWEALSKAVQKDNENEEAGSDLDLAEVAGQHGDFPILEKPSLDTLREGNSGEESFSTGSEDGLTPSSTPEKELV